MTSRRGFLGGIFAVAASPAIVRAASLMPVAAPKIIVPPTDIITPDQLFGEFLYKGDGATARTIQHNLGWAPQFIMIKASNKAVDWKFLPLGGGQMKRRGFLRARGETTSMGQA